MKLFHQTRVRFGKGFLKKIVNVDQLVLWFVYIKKNSLVGSEEKTTFWEIGSQDSDS